MIDLDPILCQWIGATPWEQPLSNWSEQAALNVTESLSEQLGINVSWYDPPDEEWLTFGGENDWGMLSTLFPLALATQGLATPLRQAAPQLSIVIIDSDTEENLRASPDVLQATLLRHGWLDDFNTEAFCASDLFVESV